MRSTAGSPWQMGPPSNDGGSVLQVCEKLPAIHWVYLQIVAWVPARDFETQAHGIALRCVPAEFLAGHRQGQRPFSFKRLQRFAFIYPLEFYRFYFICRACPSAPPLLPATTPL